MYLRLINAFANAIFPHQCLICKSFYICNKKFDDINLLDCNQVLLPFLCSNCLSKLLSVKPPICKKCGITLPSKTYNICENCLNFPKYFNMARSFGVYYQSLRQCIHLFKYNAKIQLARPLSIMLLSVFIKYWKNQNIDFIIPVPLHIKRFKKRRFNQTYLLVKDWPKLTKNSQVKIKSEQIEKKILARIRPTKSQVGMNQQERMVNIKNAFKVLDINKIYGKYILIIDDVYTTGATTNECAKSLIENGAKKVDVLTLAQA